MENKKDNIFLAVASAFLMGLLFGCLMELLRRYLAHDEDDQVCEEYIIEDADIEDDDHEGILWEDETEAYSF